jgi:hypothetical protein
MSHVLRPGSYIYINVPSNVIYHSCPYDNWRFYPDAGLALEAWANKLGLRLELVESFTAQRERNSWNDFVMVFANGAAKPDTYLFQLLFGHLQHKTMSRDLSLTSVRRPRTRCFWMVSNKRFPH